MLTLPAPCVLKSFIKIEIILMFFFFFTHLCGGFKSFMKAFKAFMALGSWNKLRLEKRDPLEVCIMKMLLLQLKNNLFKMKISVKIKKNWKGLGLYTRYEMECGTSVFSWKQNSPDEQLLQLLFPTISALAPAHEILRYYIFKHEMYSATGKPSQSISS